MQYRASNETLPRKKISCTGDWGHPGSSHVLFRSIGSRGGKIEREARASAVKKRIGLVNNCRGFTRHALHRHDQTGLSLVACEGNVPNWAIEEIVRVEVEGGASMASK